MKKLIEFVKSHKSLVIVLIVVFCIINLIQHGQNIKNNSFETIILDSGWDMNYNGKVFNDVTLSKYKFDMTNRGDELIFFRKLPEKEISHPVLVNKLYHSAMTVSVDDKVIYEYGNDLYEKNSNVGNNLTCIELPDDYAGKKLTVRILVSEDNAYSGIGPFEICNETQFGLYIVSSDTIGVYIGLFTLAFGIIMLLFIMVAGWSAKSFFRLLWIAMICISFGCWSCSFYNVFQLFIHNHVTILYLEYLGLFCMAPSILMFFINSISKRKTKIAVISLLVVFAIVITISIICNAMDIAHFCVFQNFFMFLSLIAVALVISVMFNDYKNKKASDKIITQGFFVLILAGAIVIIKFILLKYVFGTAIEVSLFSITALLFVIIMLVSYMEYTKEMIKETAEKNVLSKLAYTDTLTDISNRASCDKYLSELDIKKHESVAIIYFDLNNLKVINDTMGHLRGDNYIREFAKLLKKYFEEHAFIGRMGGDEFIAVIRDAKIININEQIENMLIASDDINNPNIGLKLSFAYGISDSDNDKTRNIDELCKIADQRMYVRKRMQKGER